jgi:D-xylonolactonase
LLKEGRLTTVIDGIAGEEDGRFNDVTAAPSGNVFCGTLSHRQGGTGSLYHLRRDRTLQKVIDGVGVANGMGFSPDLTRFYFTDSDPARTVYGYQYHYADDTFHDETVFAHLPPESGLPDGLVVDAKGYVWSARWDGGKVIRFKPSGSIDTEIVIPGAKKVSSATFGGSEYRDMYVTTAGGGDKSANGENAGALFRIRFAKLAGQPDYRSRIDIP